MTFRLWFALVLTLGAAIACWLDARPPTSLADDGSPALRRFLRRVERRYRRLRFGR